MSAHERALDRGPYDQILERERSLRLQAFAALNLDLTERLVKMEAERDQLRATLHGLIVRLENVQANPEASYDEALELAKLALAALDPSPEKET